MSIRIPRPAKDATYFRCIRGQGVTGKLQDFQRALGDRLVPRAASVLNDHRYIAKVGPMAHAGLDAHLSSDPTDGEVDDAQVAQGRIEEGSLEGAHGDLVRDGLARE